MGERLEDFLALNYPVELTKDEDGYFVRIPDLPGCESSGATLEEAMEAIAEAKAAWIEAALEARGSAPLPRGEDEFSGKFVVRVRPSVHRDLVRIASLEGVSLNALVSAVLAQETGRASSRDHWDSESKMRLAATEAHTDELVCSAKSVGDWTVYENKATAG